MSNFFLKFSCLESQIIVFCPENVTFDVSINGILLENSCIRFCITVKNLVILPDSQLTLEQQVIKCVFSLFSFIKTISIIKHYLTEHDMSV